jgi:uncharacterized membrane protein
MRKRMCLMTTSITWATSPLTFEIPPQTSCHSSAIGVPSETWKAFLCRNNKHQFFFCKSLSLGICSLSIFFWNTRVGLVPTLRLFICFLFIISFILFTLLFPQSFLLFKPK